MYVQAPGESGYSGNDFQQLPVLGKSWSNKNRLAIIVFFNRAAYVQNTSGCSQLCCLVINHWRLLQKSQVCWLGARIFTPTCLKSPCVCSKISWSITNPHRFYYLNTGFRDSKDSERFVPIVVSWNISIGWFAFLLKILLLEAMTSLNRGEIVLKTDLCR